MHVAFVSMFGASITMILLSFTTILYISVFVTGGQPSFLRISDFRIRTFKGLNISNDVPKNSAGKVTTERIRKKQAVVWQY